MLRKLIKPSETADRIQALLQQHQLHTVCQSARCPNKHECYGAGTATFLILGDVCTRGCSFCSVTSGTPSPPDPDEPARLAAAADEMGLAYAVITSVTRDDLADGGAAHFAAVVKALRKARIQVELLIPDFAGSAEALKTVLASRPDVLGHNLETVPRLYADVRPGADYQRSLELLKRAKELSPAIKTKSGIMLGMGEEREEVLSVLRDMRYAKCDILTLGQYLQPTGDHHRVERELPPEEFEAYREAGLQMGFRAAAAGTFVRSSYRARETYEVLGIE